MKICSLIAIAALFLSACRPNPTPQKVTGKWLSEDKSLQLELRADGTFDRKIISSSGRFDLSTATSAGLVPGSGKWSLDGNDLTFSNPPHNPDITLEVVGIGERKLELKFGGQSAVRYSRLE